MTIDEFIAFYLPDEPEVLGGHVLRRTGTARGSHNVADDLPPSFEERRECARSPDQVVWACDDDQAVVVHESFSYSGGYLRVEFWADEERYHDRLDELAGELVA